MKVIGITGSIASGKSTVAQLIAKKKYPLFNADNVVSNLYNNDKFINFLIKKFDLRKTMNIKEQIKLIVKKNRNKLKVLETIIHPHVRNEMNIFLKKKQKILILEIPLLIESKLTKYFDKIILVDAKKNIRLGRYLKKHNDKKTFEILNQRQLPSIFKKKICNLTIINNSSILDLKKKFLKFIKNYE